MGCVLSTWTLIGIAEHATLPEAVPRLHSKAVTL